MRRSQNRKVWRGERSTILPRRPRPVGALGAARGARVFLSTSYGWGITRAQAGAPSFPRWDSARSRRSGRAAFLRPLGQFPAPCSMARAALALSPGSATGLIKSARKGGGPSVLDHRPTEVIVAQT